MSCAACSARVEKAVGDLKGVESCSVNLLTNSMSVDGDISDEEIISAVEAAGYGATRPVESNDTDAGRSANRRIEISMILKDETVLDIVDEYLKMELPEAPAANGTD